MAGNIEISKNCKKHTKNHLYPYFFKTHYIYPHKLYMVGFVIECRCRICILKFYDVIYSAPSGKNVN